MFVILDTRGQAPIPYLRRRDCAVIDDPSVLPSRLCDLTMRAIVKVVRGAPGLHIAEVTPLPCVVISRPYISAALPDEARALREALSLAYCSHCHTLLSTLLGVCPSWRACLEAVFVRRVATLGALRQVAARDACSLHRGVPRVLLRVRTVLDVVSRMRIGCTLDVAAVEARTTLRSIRRWKVSVDHRLPQPFAGLSPRQYVQEAAHELLRRDALSRHCCDLPA